MRLPGRWRAQRHTHVCWLCGSRGTRLKLQTPARSGVARSNETMRDCAVLAWVWSPARVTSVTLTRPAAAQVDYPLVVIRRYDDFGWRDVHIWGCVMKAIGMCGQSATFLCDFAHACADRNRDWLEWREWSIAIFLTKRVTPHRCRRLVLRFAEATFRALTGVLVCSPRYHAVLTTNRRSFVKNHQ